MSAADVALVVAIALAGAFALTNGFHDASNAIATLVATRGATPGQAVALAAVFKMAGALLLGTAVADTIATIVEPPADETVAPVRGGPSAEARPRSPSTWPVRPVRGARPPCCRPPRPWSPSTVLPSAPTPHRY